MDERGTGRLGPRVDLVWAGAFAVVLVLGTLAAAALQGDRVRTPDAGAFALVVLAALATLGLRRTAPVWALAGAMAAVSAYLLAGYPYGPVQLCMVIAVFEVSRQRQLRTSLGACAVAAIVASGSVLPRLIHEVDAPAVLAAGWAAWIVLPWSLGALVHVSAAARAQVRRDLIARAAAEERVRLAGEVHDVAGHGFALVAMHAGVALLVFDEQPDQARASLQAIKATSDRSLAALRGTLDTFHPRECGPGLADVEALIREVRAGGLAVDLTMDELTLGEEVDGVVYRVVQESLTNVLRHAGPTAAEVRIARVGDDVLVRVTDRGCGADGVVAEGRGLAGMRSRVEAVGGRFGAGPDEGGGFAVAARMPLPGGDR
ncbi:sensor histidine kinase [Pseudonocardia kunmingensis]|uniref:histidine kinase n=1 Tax=Pseudonocardia kunmingensis TaxID=630975 RepID=A0A543CXJ7_9PSEU|nr:histidine kinase [Pseudonocardia kunmingensis]TQM01791.1 signal transduction histidine kinase [Pseudonocardia kunmingensis]